MEGKLHTGFQILRKVYFLYFFKNLRHKLKKK
jgi:hypothetical protein